MNDFYSYCFLKGEFSVKRDYFKRFDYSMIIIFIFIILFSNGKIYSQQTSSYYQPNLTNQTATTKQEIARFDIKVARGEQILPLSQVPRVRQGDVIKFRLIDEPIGGVKLDQTAWDWTLVVAYANPLVNKEKEETVSPEIKFRKTGWYREYSFKVPFDSQPVFFLSPRSGFRDQIAKAMTKNFGDISKIGEKMVEISGAYAQIQTFLSELQTVVNRNQYGYNPYGYDPYGNSGGTYNPYGQTPYGSSYNYGSSYGYNNPYGTRPGVYNQTPARLDLVVERLAKSFNIQMPNCWYYNNPSAYNNNYNSGSGTSSYYSGSSGYPSSYYGGTYTGTTTGGYFQSTPEFSGQDFVARSQCVAKSVNLEDFDISITRMWQQGGVFLAAELQRKYPQLAFYINIAAAAIDFIVKAFQKSPVRIVPTVLAAAGNSNNTNIYQTSQASSAGTANGYSSSYYQGQNFQAASLPTAQLTDGLSASGDSKLSLFSNTPPSNQGFLTTYPVVIQKWQAEPDAEIVRLNTPALNDSCLHVGINILKNTSLSNDFTADNFTRDFKLIVNSDNGFRKEFPLRKNLGLGGWELNLTPPDAAQIPKVAMSLEAEISGTRGFNEIKSDKFKLPVATASQWEIVPETQRDFAVGGGRHIVALRNAIGSCLCIQSVTYKPSFGGQFTFDRNGGENSMHISPDNLSVWFEIDTAKFQPGVGTLEIKTFGGETATVNIKLYPALPEIKNVRVARGDRQILLTGERLEQLRFIVVGGYRATVLPNTFPPDDGNPQLSTKIAIFDNPQIRQTGTSATIELGLEDGRRFSFPQSFPILPSRPTIAADANNEIEGISDATLTIQNKLPIRTKRNLKTVAGNTLETETIAPGASIAAQLVAVHAPVFPITTKIVSLSVKNVLNDFDFQSENITIETRIEKSQVPAGDYLKSDFEVLDRGTMRLKFFLYGDTHTNLGGRRIQFRIRDRERGDSDWYTIKQTFIRLPQIISVKCTPDMKGMCELKGDGMDYVGQVSIDAGKTWFQGEKEDLEAQPTADGMSMVMIPQLINKKLLQVKLRDFPNTSGLSINNFIFNNTKVVMAVNKVSNE